MAYDWACTMERLPSCRFCDAILSVYCGNGHSTFSEGYIRVFFSSSSKEDKSKVIGPTQWCLTAYSVENTRKANGRQKGDSKDSQTSILGPLFTRSIIFLSILIFFSSL